jgi:hypothetical protein
MVSGSLRQVLAHWVTRVRGRVLGRWWLRGAGGIGEASRLVALGKPAGGREVTVAGRKAGVGYGRAASGRQRVCPENFQMETVHIMGRERERKLPLQIFLIC